MLPDENMQDLGVDIGKMGIQESNRPPRYFTASEIDSK